MPENNDGTIPKTVKVGDHEFTLADHPELLALVEAGRKNEKSKLYSQIGSLETEIKTLKDSKKSGEELSAKDKEELKKLQDQLAVANSEVEKLKKPEGGTPPAGGKEEPKGGMTQEQIDAIVNKALEKQKSEYDKKFEELGGSLNKKTVGDYRKEQLAKYKGLVIEQLVPESLDSEEAVNSAIKQAMETSKQYIRKDYVDAEGKTSNLTLAEIEELEKKTPTPPAGGGQQSYEPAGSPPPPPPGGGGGLDAKALVKDLKNMPQADFNKNREAIKQEILKVGYGDDESK